MWSSQTHLEPSHILQPYINPLLYFVTRVDQSNQLMTNCFQLLSFPVHCVLFLLFQLFFSVLLLLSTTDNLHHVHHLLSVDLPHDHCPPVGNKAPNRLNFASLVLSSHRVCEGLLRLGQVANRSLGLRYFLALFHEIVVQKLSPHVQQYVFFHGRRNLLRLSLFIFNLVPTLYYRVVESDPRVHLGTRPLEELQSLVSELVVKPQIRPLQRHRLKPIPVNTVQFEHSPRLGVQHLHAGLFGHFSQPHHQVLVPHTSGMYLRDDPSGLLADVDLAPKAQLHHAEVDLHEDEMFGSQQDVLVIFGCILETCHFVREQV